MGFSFFSGTLPTLPYTPHTVPTVKHERKLDLLWGCFAKSGAGCLKAVLDTMIYQEPQKYSGAKNIPGILVSARGYGVKNKTPEIIRLF